MRLLFGIGVTLLLAVTVNCQNVTTQPTATPATTTTRTSANVTIKVTTPAPPPANTTTVLTTVAPTAAVFDNSTNIISLTTTVSTNEKTSSILQNTTTSNPATFSTTLSEKATTITAPTVSQTSKLTTTKASELDITSVASNSSITKATEFEVITDSQTVANTTKIPITTQTVTTHQYETTAESGSGVETTSAEIPTQPESTTAESTTRIPLDTSQPSTSQPETTGAVVTSEESTTAESQSTGSSPTTSSSKPPDTTKSTTSSSTPSAGSSNIALPISLTILALVLIIFIVVLYFYCTGKNLPCFGKNSGEHEIIEMPPRKPSNAAKFAVGHMSINREEFEVQFKRKIADDGRGYREEFKAVQTESSTMSAARDPVNAPKNRYDNVLPWDSSRVVLSIPASGSPSDDYINANYVPGYLQDKKFIACQGPKDTTCADFWRMVWDQKCATIVMVTNLVEAKKPKCHQYWPGDDMSEGETAKFGDYVVTLTDVKIRNFFVTRTLKLQHGDESPRILRQLHYTAWPDFGVPKNPHELLLFRRRIIAANPPHSGPIVVHCSAGVGRTGTYILIDASMEELRAEGKVDLFSFLTKMRKSRMMLVQTDAQYTFAHAALLEHIKYGDTEVSVKKFRAQVQSLREQVEGADETLLDQQFSTMLKVQMNKDNMKHGRQNDDNRVTLPLKPGQEKSDYINASFIDGFKDRRSFIATQGPLNETCSDFWMMAWVYNCQNIVMLTGLMEKGHEMCTQYWPSEVDGEKTFGDITVKYVSKDDDDVVDYVVREFIITNSAAPDEEERKIRQFHYSGWPEVGLPSDAHGMIEIANRLNSKDKDGFPRPSIVHCSSGGGRTGVFITLNILMEQADNEGLVDVFQVVKSLRAQRPHIIQTQEQFYFCYVALLQYLETNQLAEDSTTLTSNLNSSIGNRSQSVAPSNGGIPITQFLGVENTTPQGSMNNKLDMNSISDQDLVSQDIKPPSPINELPPPPPPESPSPPPPPEPPSPTIEATPEIGSPESHGADSNQALLNDATNSDENTTSNASSQSEFEIVNETNQDNAVKV
ncbi:receptor-type tyrosine-protein phosphatase epsilon-like isoform X3 [Styela clava]